jgi:hypothetical protein
MKAMVKRLHGASIIWGGVRKRKERTSGGGVLVGGMGVRVLNTVGCNKFKSKSKYRYELFFARYLDLDSNLLRPTVLGYIKPELYRQSRET